MSGIMGIRHLNSHPVNHQYLEKMVEILAHRGPDHADIWVEESVGLGHRMLWTTPESLIEKLPLVNLTGNLVITADARIDNREQLMTLLTLPERSIEKITDSEFILAAYEKWGESCPEYLLGDFAFAIWDQHQQSLFCARDHLGIKPFYYYYQPNQIFLFASEIKALFCVPNVPRRLNEVRIADYLTLTMSDKAITTYRDIWRLPPAHSLVVNQSGVHIWSYWSLNAQKELQLESNAAYAAEFRKIFTEAVNCRLRSAFAIATHLSGGLDSSAVTCVARNLLAKDGKTSLHTISTIFDKITECDERPFINAVLDQGGFIPHYVHGEQFSPLADLDKIFQYEDEALLGPSHFYPWNLNRISQEMGLRICLDGFDGDTTVGHGTTRLTELIHQGKWKTFAQEVKALSPHHHVSPAAVLQSYGLPYLRDLAKQWRWIAFAQGVQQIHQHFGVSRKLLLIHHGIKPLLKSVLQLWRRRQDKSPNLINPDFAERIRLNERMQILADSSEPPLTVKQDQWLSLTQGLLTYTLEQMDQYAAMFSLEARHPFMDKRLIEFCLALPSEQKLYQGWGRMVMRRALEGILPQEVQWRGGKTDLTANFIDGLLKRDRHILDQMMSNRLGNIEKFIDIDFLRSAYKRLISAGNQVSDADSMAIWQAVTLALWLDYKQVML
ncbi:lasso peptide isopeptide bond-forming cyclase [Halotia branconii]|uniref:asparagine synthase (glutamine-hydrolyzing) n=1 Tax=Halotia branconii CENA392 TaxID=1539056 RepID=A0AAJ6NVZ1_9CYAN|nr:lasso peptide isopeptide bond-forming cyclase [Halotia branconii]WGV27617.1 lasso peptide isopeptide bond-forming cyclase [Halotia branconii CENA392]